MARDSTDDRAAAIRRRLEEAIAAGRCPACGAPLDDDGRCPGDGPPDRAAVEALVRLIS